MAQASTEDEDMCIQFNYDFVYNVSDFLRQYDSSAYAKIRMKKFNEFIQLLDMKVFIDTNDPRYSHIYQGIDTIVKRVIEELMKLDSFYVHVNLRRTGSSTSGVKVGLPHEADYVLGLPKDKQLVSGDSFDRRTLFLHVKQIVTERSAALIQGLQGWLIHGTHEYEKTGGVCLVMECKSCVNDPASEKVGVTVDLTPAFMVESTDESFNEKAAAYLPDSLNIYAKKGEVYRLLRTDKCDTGYIENSIMAQLPEEIKKSYRVCSYENCWISVFLKT